MSLQPQTKTVPLYGGINTKTDPKYVAPNMLLSAQNVRFFGVNSAQKRYGQTALTAAVGVGGKQITAGKALGAFNNELLLFDGAALYSYAQAQGAWASRGALTEVLIAPTPIIRSSGSASGIACALTGTTELYAWEDSRGGVWYAIRDPSSGAFSISATQLDATGASPQIVVAGALTYVFYTSGTTIWAVSFNTANPANGIISQQMVASNGTVGVPIVAVGSTGSALAQNTILLCYQESAGSTFHVKLFSFALAVLQNTTFTYAVAAANHIAAAFSTDGSRAFVVVTTAAAVKIVPVNTSSGATSTAFTAYVTTAALKATAVGTAASTIQLYWDDLPASSVPRINQALITFSAATTITAGSTTVLQGMRIASQPVVVSGSSYLVGCSTLTNLAGVTSQQTSFFLLGGSPLVNIQRFFGASAYNSGSVLPSLSLNTAGQIFVGLGQRTSLRADASGTIYSPVGITNCYFTFPSASLVSVTSFGTTALINCGNTYTYDGAQLVESGFWEFPDGISAVVSGGGNLNAGAYIYIVTYEWTDAAGNIHYSGGSWPLTVTTSVGSKVTLTVPYTVLTRKTDAVIGIYRTATSPSVPLGTDTGLGPWFKVATLPNITTGAASVTYFDNATDASLQGQQFLYAPSDGTGEVDNEAPPPFSYMVATKTRVFGIAQDDPTALWYSKPTNLGGVGGSRPAEFSSAFIVRIEQDGGNATALSALDTQAIIFKRHKIEYLPGDGPNAAGQNNFGALQLITSTSGCTSAPSILPTTDGIFYKSDIGISVLNRSLTVDATIGLPVQGFNSLTLTGAQAISAQNQLRWTSSAGTALVYDYITKGWSTYTNYDAAAYALWQDQGTRLKATGQVLFEDSTTYLDNGAPVSILVETSWQKTSEMAQGFGAVWYAMILGEYFSSHNLVVEVAYDYIDTPLQTATWNATLNGNFGAFGSDATYGAGTVFGANINAYTTPYQVRVALSRQVCEALKFKIYDSGISGQSCTLNEIAIQLGVIGGLNRGPSRQQV